MSFGYEGGAQQGLEDDSPRATGGSEVMCLASE